MFDIYVITNITNGKKYVGYTSIGYQKRFLKHVNESERGSNRYICRALRKYGESSFRIELIDTALTHEEAKQKEIEYISKLNSFAHKKGGHGYNATTGGDGVNGKNVPQYIREKMSELKKQQRAWVGERNPKYKKGYLIQGEKHPLFGKKHSMETKQKISIANKGRLEGIGNPSVVLEECFSLECKTGRIDHFYSFFELRQYFKEQGIPLNRSIVLGVMRGDNGRRTYKGYMFYRKDVTDAKTFHEIERKYQCGEVSPVILKDHRQGNLHPNAKSVLCFAKDIRTEAITRFESWYDLKNWLSTITGGRANYSGMAKCLRGEYNHVYGYRLYRQGDSDEEVFSSIIGEYEQQKEPSTTSQ